MTDTVRIAAANNVESNWHFGPVVHYGCGMEQYPGTPVYTYPTPNLEQSTRYILTEDHTVRYGVVLEVIAELCKKKVDHEVIQRVVEATLNRG